MSDEEYAHCMERKFNSIEYHETIPKELMTGKKFMAKSVDIGDQVSQDIGVFFPTRLDNYAKIVRQCRRYGRYMDDIYIIHHDKKELRSIMDGVIREAEKLGLFVNTKKTRIVKLSGTFKYLQVKYTLSDSGKVIKRINPKSVTRQRRRLKAYKRLYDKGELPYDDIEQSYKSWMGDYSRLMSKHQIRNMKNIYKSLFRKEPRWKKQ